MRRRRVVHGWAVAEGASILEQYIDEEMPDPWVLDT